MVETTNDSQWDGQPVNLSRHLVSLKETYTSYVSPSVVALLETGVIAERGKIYVHNHLHALMRTSDGFLSLPSAEKPYSFDNPGTQHLEQGTGARYRRSLPRPSSLCALSVPQSKILSPKASSRWSSQRARTILLLPPSLSTSFGPTSASTTRIRCLRRWRRAT